MSTTLATIIFSATLAAACAESQPEVAYAPSVNLGDPTLIQLDAGVEVVAGAREPVFRSRGAYWLYRDHGWYRADELRGQWIRIATPPTELTSINDPEAYANLRPDTRIAMPAPPAAPRPPAPYPMPPQQVPPEIPTDRVPDQVQSPEDELSRPDRMRDR